MTNPKEIAKRLRGYACEYRAAAAQYYPGCGSLENSERERYLREAADLLDLLDEANARCVVDEEMESIGKYLGELYAAAMHDHELADPADVGLNGVAIKHWREAYAEGIKDAADCVVTQCPESQRDKITEIARAAYKAKYHELQAAIGNRRAE